MRIKTSIAKQSSNGCSQISSAIGGYQRDDYVIVGDQLVIVDHSARRVVAIVPNIG